MDSFLKKERRAKMWKRTIFLVIAVLTSFITGCGLNISVVNTGTDQPDVSGQREVIRLDEDGYLYYMDYTKDYYGSDVIDALKKDGFIDKGCSTFFTHNPDGEPITCRNYDFAHRVSQEDSTITGLNIVLHCKPEGKYESIAMADAVWCDETNPLLQRGGPDMPGFTSKIINL